VFLFLKQIVGWNALNNWLNNKLNDRASQQANKWPTTESKNNNQLKSSDHEHLNSMTTSSNSGCKSRNKSTGMLRPMW